MTTMTTNPFEPGDVVTIRGDQSGQLWEVFEIDEDGYCVLGNDITGPLVEVHYHPDLLVPFDGIERNDP
jgi:hypothetical protein